MQRPSLFSRTARVVLSLLALVGPAQAEVVISQVYGGGGNSGATLTHDYIELLNTGTQPVNLSTWSVQYASATGSTWSRTNLSGTLQPGHYYLIQQAQGSGGSTALPSPDAIGTLAMSATAGKVALVNSQTTLSGSCPSSDASLVDLIGFGGTASCSLGAATANLSNTNAAVRRDNGCRNTRHNGDDFQITAPAPRNSASPAQSCDNGPPPPTPPVLSAAVSPSSAVAGESVLFTASVVAGANPSSSGLSVQADLSAIGGAADQSLYDDGSNGDLVAGDLIFSLRASIPIATAAGLKTVSMTASDAEGRSASADASFSVVALLPISAVQGDGQSSPLVGATVVTEGVVTGVRSNGFFIQTPDAEIDADPNTSEGLFVFTGSGQVPSTVAVGNRVRVQGRVVEFLGSGSTLPLTELSNPQVSLLATGQPLPREIVLQPGMLGSGADAGALEQFEGMRVSAARLQVVAPTLGFITERTATSSANGVFYAVLDGVARPFREPGLEPTSTLAAPANTPRFDGNFERLRIDSRGLGGSALVVDAGSELLDVRGVLDYAFGTWSLLPDEVNGYVLGSQPQPRAALAPGHADISIGGFNLLRFFDDDNDPNIGEPVLSSEAYAFRLTKTANAICHYLHAPDILGVVEVENLAVLSRLADEVNSSCPKAPAYVALLQEGNDVGGIDVGFLISQRLVAVNLPRVEVESVVQIGKDATWVQPDGSSALLNDRPSLAIEAVVNQDNGQSFALTVVANHLRSLSGAIDDTAGGDRVRRKRAEQALMVANWVEQRQQADADRPIVLLGDFNAFEFNDGLTDVMGILTGQAAGPDAVVVHAASPLSRPLLNLALTEPANERYSFSFDGNAQTLDHMLVNQAVLAQVAVKVDHARLNADFSVARFGDASNDARVSDHDPVLALLSVPQFRSADLSVEVRADRAEVGVGQRTGFQISARNAGPNAAPTQLTLRLPQAAAPVSLVPASGWTCDGGQLAQAQLVYRCDHASFAVGAVAEFLLSAAANDAFGGASLQLEASIGSEVIDPQPANNLASASTRVRAAADLGLSVVGPHTPIITGRGADFVIDLRNAGPDAAWSPTLVLEANAPASSMRLSAASGWQCSLVDGDAVSSRFECRLSGSFANAGTARFTLFADPPRPLPQTWFELRASVSSSTPDAHLANNQDSATQRVTGKR